MDASTINRAEFTATDEARWRKLAEKALKGAAFDEALVSLSDDGLAVGPIHPRAEPVLAGRQSAGNAWTIVQRVDDPDVARAHAQVLDDLEGGATGLALVFEGAPNAFGYGLPADAEYLKRMTGALDKLTNAAIAAK